MPELRGLLYLHKKHVLLQGFLLDSHQFQEFGHLSEKSQGCLRTLHSNYLSCLYRLPLSEGFNLVRI